MLVLSSSIDRVRSPLMRISPTSNDQIRKKERNQWAQKKNNNNTNKNKNNNNYSHRI